MAARLFRALLPALALAALPVSLSAQEPAAAPAGAPADRPNEEQLQAWVTELQQISGELQSIQQQALRDSALSTHQETLGEEIKTAMEALDPMLGDRMTRFEALEAEALAAQQSGDTQTLQGLAAEAQEIQAQYARIQEQVLQQPAFTEKVAAFQSHLESKMAEVNPGAAQLISRFRELEGQVTAALYGSQPS